MTSFLCFCRLAVILHGSTQRLAIGGRGANRETPRKALFLSLGSLSGVIHHPLCLGAGEQRGKGQTGRGAQAEGSVAFAAWLSKPSAFCCSPLLTKMQQNLESSSQELYQRNKTPVQCLISTQFWLLFFIHFISSGTGFVLTSNLGEVMKTLGGTSEQKAIALCMYSAANAVGRACSGRAPPSVLPTLPFPYSPLPLSSLLLVSHLFHFLPPHSLQCTQRRGRSDRAVTAAALSQLAMRCTAITRLPPFPAGGVIARCHQCNLFLRVCIFPPFAARIVPEIMTRTFKMPRSFSYILVLAIIVPVNIVMANATAGSVAAVYAAGGMACGLGMVTVRLYGLYVEICHATLSCQARPKKSGDRIVHILMVRESMRKGGEGHVVQGWRENYGRGQGGKAPADVFPPCRTC